MLCMIAGRLVSLMRLDKHVCVCAVITGADHNINATGCRILQSLSSAGSRAGGALTGSVCWTARQ